MGGGGGGGTGQRAGRGCCEGTCETGEWAMGRGTEQRGGDAVRGVRQVSGEGGGGQL